MSKRSPESVTRGSVLKACFLGLVAVCLGTMSWQATAAQVVPSGRLDLDYASPHSDTRPLHSNAIVRRAELDLVVNFNDDWAFKTSNDFARAKGGKPKNSIQNLVLTYKGWQTGDISAGQFKVPFGLDNLTSSKYIMGIERSLPTTGLAPSRHLGIGFSRNRKHYTFSVMAFGPSIDYDKGDGVGARYTFAPIDSGSTLLHLGVSFVSEVPKGSVKFKTHPESKPTEVNFVDTGKLGDVSRINRLGLEMAYQTGPFTAQMEWMRAAINRQSHPNAAFGGWYFEGGWMFGGGSRRYKYGTFKSPSLGRPYGTWELTVRYSHLDLNDAGVQGGRENNLTLGLNWYLNNHGRIMFNYISVHSDRHGVADNPDILLLQTQFFF